MRIKWKILISFLIVFVSYASIQGYMYWKTEAQQKQLKEMEERTLSAALLAEDLKLAVVQVQQWLTDISATRALDGLDDGFEQAEYYAKQFTEKIETLKQIQPLEAAMLDETQASFDTYYEMGQKMADEYIKGGTARGNLIMKQFDETAEDINQRIDELRNAKIAEVTEALHQISLTNKSNNQTSAIFSIVILGVIFFIAFMVSRFVTTPLNRLGEMTKRIAEGDLSQPIHSTSRDEIGELSRSFETMRNSLSALILRLKDDSQKLSATSQELAAGVEEMSSSGSQISLMMEEISNGAEAQARGADDSSLAMDEMAVGIQRIAEVSSEVADLSSATAQEAISGNASMQKVIEKMNTINETVLHASHVVAELGKRSDEINQIIEVIRNITGQTHILALNAGIEAARAGEHGKGFAVVANEVKKLAEQSRQSTELIETIIKHIQADTAKAIASIETGTRETNEGIEIANEAGELFKRILNDAKQVAGQIEEVSASTEQMSAGFEEVTASIGELKSFAKESHGRSRDVADFTQSQLSTIQNISDSAGELSKMAHELNEAIDHFKLNS